MKHNEINQLLEQLSERVQHGELRMRLVPLLVELATKLEESDNPRWHDDARRLRFGVQSIHRGGAYGGFVPQRV